MAWTAPRTWVAGDVLTAAQMNTDVRDNMREVGQTAGVAAAGTSFTPTLSQGWLLGNATVDATYHRTGRWIAFQVVITVGSTTTKGTTLEMALPVAASATQRGAAGFKAQAYVAGANWYVLMVIPQSASLVRLFAVNASGTYASWTNITASIPATWATGDIIHVGGEYEAAS